MEYWGVLGHKKLYFSIEDAKYNSMFKAAITVVAIFILASCSPYRPMLAVKRNVISGTCTLVWEQEGQVDGWKVCTVTCGGESCVQVSQRQYPVSCAGWSGSVLAYQGALESERAYLINN